MQLRDMEAFLAVCRSGSLVAAVGHYPLTVSALSKAIRRVEREVGVDLLIGAAPAYR
ncbi:MAG: LysR family transcriptional regulator [Pseudoxanthomonas sp.]|nr:MAG: LysR family transcriptional regulator [Pseudoxanthomonas sp.]